MRTARVGKVPGKICRGHLKKKKLLVELRRGRKLPWSDVTNLFSDME